MLQVTCILDVVDIHSSSILDTTKLNSGFRMSKIKRMKYWSIERLIEIQASHGDVRERACTAYEKNNCCHRVYKQLTILYKYYSSRHTQRLIIRNCFGLKRSGFVRTEDNTCHIVNKIAKSDAIKRIIFNNNYPDDVSDDIHKELRLRFVDLTLSFAYLVEASHVERKQNRSSMNRGRKMDSASITIRTTILMEYAYSCAFKLDRRRKKKKKKK